MTYLAARTGHTVAGLTTRLAQGLREASRRPDRGDISITTVIIWVAAVAGAGTIAATIYLVINKYNLKLDGV
ncbi:hypothetical protein ABZX77_17450 [Streptomyces sp. NPDC004237]|uniref:DUF4235 domain-containing protein n=1 Tax=Streptomyces sp. R39 TaxID=3238631 RepID=A0AB39R262_9ACTN